MYLTHGALNSSRFSPSLITVFLYLQDPERSLHDCNFQISNPINRSIFKPLSLSIYVGVMNFFFPPERHLFSSAGSAFIRIKYTRVFFPLFALVSALSVSLPSNDTFYHSEEFSISLPGFKEIDFKGLERLKNED